MDNQNIGGHVVNLYKNLGETPRERLERLRVQKTQYQYEILSYAGRLDPMAEGVMICLVGAENSRHGAYLDLSKEYTLDVLFGFSTDTYDVLGKVMQEGSDESISRKSVEPALNEFRGAYSQEYPPFSSRTINGIPMFELAKKNMLNAAVLPRRNVTVHQIDLAGMYHIKEQQLLSYIETGIAKVHGDFRQEEILDSWRRLLRPNGSRTFACITINFACSSGTYARSIAQNLGIQLGVPALALHIFRTKVGEHDISKSLR